MADPEGDKGDAFTTSVAITSIFAREKYRQSVVTVTSSPNLFTGFMGVSIVSIWQIVTTRRNILTQNDA